MKGYHVVGILTGIITSAIGGWIRFAYFMGNDPPEWASFGLRLFSALCLFVPVIAGFFGWLGAWIADRASKSDRVSYLGGVLGGLIGAVITTLLFIPIPSLL